MPSAPKQSLPCRSLPLSVASMPSRPSGGCAFTSATASMRRIVLPMRGLDQLHADGAGGEHDLRAFEVLGARRLVGALHGRDLHAETRLDRLRRLLGTLLRARGERDVGTFLRKHRRGAHADRTGAGEHHRLLALELLRLGEQRHAGGRRGVGAVRIEHHRDAEGAEELLLHRLEQRLALGHVAAADEDRGVLLLLAAAGEDRAVDESADIVRRDIGIARHAVGAAVIGDHRVEHARVRIGVEQEQQLLHLVFVPYSTTFCGLPPTNASILSMS